MKLKYLTNDADTLRDRQFRRHIFRMMSLAFNFGMFIIVNAALVVINYVTSPGEWWFYWITLFWGLGLIGHVFSFFNPFNNAFGDEWEARKIRELMGEKSKREYFD